MPNVAQALSFGPDSTKLFGRLNQLVNLSSLVDSVCIKTVVYVTTNKWLYCMTHYLFYVFFSILTYIEDITCPCVDITFIFECSTPYLTRLLRSLKQWEWEDLFCNHNDGDLCTCEDNMLFSRVKIWSFHAKAPLVFHWCLYNKYIYFKFYRCLVSSVDRALVCCADVNTQGRKITEENLPPLWLYLQHI